MLNKKFIYVLNYFKTNNAAHKKQSTDTLTANKTKP